MNRYLFVILSGLTMAAWLAGCQSAPPGRRTGTSSARVLDAAAAQAAGFSPPEADQAARLHTAKCARCHQFYDPADYNDTEWRSWMVKMSKKARLKPDQQELLSRYLEALRGEHPMLR